MRNAFEKNLSQRMKDKIEHEDIKKGKKVNDKGISIKM